MKAYLEAAEAEWIQRCICHCLFKISVVDVFDVGNIVEGVLLVRHCRVKTTGVMVRRQVLG